MTLNHHLDDATILQYAAGELDAAFTLVAACHLAMCSTCRNSARLAESVGGALLDQIEPAAVDATRFAHLADELDSAPHEHSHQSGVPAPGNVPLPLRRFLGDRLEDIRWRRLVPGVGKHVIDLGKDCPSSLYLLNIGPGMAMPEHGHGGNEATLILSGAYRDEIGYFGPGDIADLDEDVEHQPRVVSEEPCICLAATETRTRFKGRIARLMQPYLGI